MKPSACSSKEVAMKAFLARVTSWGKAKALSPDEAWLNGGRVGGLGVKRSAGEGRQDTQDIEKKRGLSEGKRCRCTGTPTFGLPPVFSGPVAVFIVDPKLIDQTM